MKDHELEQMFKEQPFGTQSALIECEHGRGIAFEIGEVLSSIWRQGDVIVFWPDSEHTILPETFELLVYDVWHYEQES